MNDMIFKNRADAGKKLAIKLRKYCGQETVIFALPRGGVILGKIISEELRSPLDLVTIRKIGHPENQEYAIGAISEQGWAIMDENETKYINKEWLRQEKEKQQKEAKRRREVYTKNKVPIEVKDKLVIIVDDGVATGLTMLAAIKELRQKNPKRIVAAVPVASTESAELIKKEADEFVALFVPHFFKGAIGSYYLDFGQVSDDEVINIMAN